MARSECENDYKFYRAQLQQARPSAVAYLDNVDMNHWVKYCFVEAYNLPTYDEITSNLAEQTNSWIGNKCRSAKPLDAFSLFFFKLNKLISAKRQLAQAWIDQGLADEPVPELQRKIEELTKASEKCKSDGCLDLGYTVRFAEDIGAGGFVHPWRLVDLLAHECTCMKWQDESFPCVHAVAAAIEENMAIETLYDSAQVSVRHFQRTYTKAFRPYPSDVRLTRDEDLRIELSPPEPTDKGKRGLKPGPKPKHKRRVANKSRLTSKQA